MIYNIIMRAFVGGITALSIAVLVYVYAFPPESTRASRDGVPYFTSRVMHPETGEPLNVNVLARHFKGE